MSLKVRLASKRKPAGWELVWADGADGEITAGIESGYGARYLRLSSYAGWRPALKLGGVEAADMEALVEVFGVSERVGFVLRAQGDGASGHSAYHLRMTPSGLQLVREAGSAYPYGAGWESLATASDSTAAAERLFGVVMMAIDILTVKYF